MNFKMPFYKIGLLFMRRLFQDSDSAGFCQSSWANCISNYLLLQENIVVFVCVVSKRFELLGYDAYSNWGVMSKYPHGAQRCRDRQMLKVEGFEIAGRNALTEYVRQRDGEMGNFAA